MKSFIQYINESGKLYRFDDKQIIPSAQDYATSPDGTESGRVSPDWQPPSDWKRSKGLFAGQYHHVLSYAVPRDTRWIVTGKKGKNEKQTIHFDEADRERISSHSPTLSQYNRRQGFKRTLGGEYFASGEDAPKPIKQTKITDPLSHIEKHYNINFVKNLTKHKRDLESQGVHHTAEGDFEVNETIVKSGNKWLLKTKDGSRTLGTHSSRDKALAQERAIKASEARRA